MDDGLGPGFGPGMFHALAESYVDPLFFASGGVIRWIAPGVEEVLGWSAGQLEQVALADLVADQDSGELERLLQRVIAGKPGRGVFRFRSRDGGYLWVLVTLARRPEELGVDGVIGSLREINLRFERERHLQLIAAQTADVVVTVDPALRITWVSSTIPMLTGTDADAVVGVSLVDLFHPDDRGSAQARLRDSSAAASAPDADTSVELRVSHASGTSRWVRLSSSWLADDLDDRHQLVAVIRDVDAFVRARESVLAEADQLLAVLNGMQDPHCLLAPVRDDRAWGEADVSDFRFEGVNELAREFLGRHREDIVGRTLTELLPGVEGTGLIEQFEAAMASGGPVTLDDVALTLPDLGGERRLDIRGIRVGESLSMVWRDVTDRRTEEEALAASEEKYRLLAENAADVVVRQQGGVIAWVSPSVREALGWAPEEWIGHGMDEFIHPDNLEGRFEDNAVSQAGAVVVRRSRMLARDGSYHWVHAHAKPYIDAQGRNAGTVMSMHVVDNEVATEADLDRRARYDDLTGLLARNEVLARIAAPSGLLRHPGERTAVLFCDLDRFKDVNDTHGHLAGDEVLRVVALRLREGIRIDDLAARVGGDEFLAVLNRVHDLADAVRVADKIRQAAAEPIELPEGMSVTVSMSIGVTLARTDEATDQLIRRADAAMYDAKARGRDQVIAISDDGAQTGRDAADGSVGVSAAGLPQGPGR